MRLSLGLLKATVTLCSFVAILWHLSGDFSLTLGGQEVSIPGYMVWVALIYSIVGTWLTNKIGNPLVKLNFSQQRYEADFRFNLMRLRENGESIALYGGEKQEQGICRSGFGKIINNYLKIILIRQSVPSKAVIC